MDLSWTRSEALWIVGRHLLKEGLVEVGLGKLPEEFVGAWLAHILSLILQEIED